MSQSNVVHRMVRSAGAATVSQVWRLVVTFATHWLLRRMITPDEMGVWVWAEPLFLVLAQVRDVGLPGHVVRSEPRLFGNFLRVEVVWGGLLALGLAAGAPLLRHVFLDAGPDFERIVRTLCLFLFVQGLGSVPLTCLEAELRVDKAVPAELVRNIVFAAMSLGMAVKGYGVWSIIVAHLVAASVFAAMLWRAAWPHLDLAYRRGATRSLVHLAWPLALISLLEQAVLRLDPLVLGRFFDSEVIGFVGLATYAVFFFPRLLAESVGRAVYPALVRYQDDPPRAFEAFRLATLLLLTLAVPTAFGLFLNAEWAARFLGGETWVGAADYLRVLALVPLLRPLGMFGFELLLTKHRDRLLMLYSATNLLTLGGLGYLLVQTDLRELGMAVAGYAPLGMVVLAWGIHRLDPRAFRGLTLDILGLYLVAVVLFAPVELVTADATLGRLLLSTAAGLAVLGYGRWRFGDAFRRFLEPA